MFILFHLISVSLHVSKYSAHFSFLKLPHRRAFPSRRFITSRHFYTHVDLDQAASLLGDRPTKSGRFEDSMDGALDQREALQSWFAELSESQQQTLHLFFF